MRNKARCHRAQLLRTAFPNANANATFEPHVVQKQCLCETGERQVAQKERLSRIVEGQVAQTRRPSGIFERLA